MRWRRLCPCDSQWCSLVLPAPRSTRYTVNMQISNVTSDVTVRVNIHWFHLFHMIHCEHTNMECYIRCHCESQCSLVPSVPHDTLWTYKHGMLHQMSLWQLMMFTGSTCSTFHTIHCEHTNRECYIRCCDNHCSLVLPVPHHTLWTCKHGMLHQMSPRQCLLVPPAPHSTPYTVNMQTWNVTSDVIVTVTVHWFCLFHTIHCEHANMECYIRCHCDSQCSLVSPVPHSTQYTVNMQTRNVTSAVIVTVNVHWFHLFHIPHPTLWTCKHGMLQQVSLRQDFFF